ncbi:MAG: phage tail assembly chaperone [Alphaproteobacteria bacterium]
MQPAARPFPWDDAMAAGLGLLCLPPAQFWAMTPRELSVALGGALGVSVGGLTQAPGQTELSALMQRFPDI